MDRLWRHPGLDRYLAHTHMHPDQGECLHRDRTPITASFTAAAITTSLATTALTATAPTSAAVTTATLAAALASSSIATADSAASAVR